MFNNLTAIESAVKAVAKQSVARGHGNLVGMALNYSNPKVQAEILDFGHFIKHRLLFL